VVAKTLNTWHSYEIIGKTTEVVVDVSFITAKKVGKRTTQNAVYPIVYIPSEVNAFLNLKPGDRIVIYMPDSADHFEVWPMSEFLKRRNEGRL